MKAFVKFVDDLRLKTVGVDLATDIIEKFLDRGPDGVSSASPEKASAASLDLSRGLVLTARILDLVSAPDDTPEADMVSCGHGVSRSDW